MGAALVGGTLGSLGIGEAGADPPGCKRLGKRCTRDTQCCGSLVCLSGTCQTQTTTPTPTTSTTETPTTSTTTPMYLPNGGTCTADSECCTNICDTGICASCRSEFSTCDADIECCTGICSLTRCSRCRQGGDICATTGNCCSGLTCQFGRCL